MKLILSLLALLGITCSALGADPTTGQFLFQKKNATGPFTQYGLTPANGQGMGWVGGVPTNIPFAVSSDTLAQFAATTSAQLAGVISDESGTGALLFGTAPNINSSITSGSTTFTLLNATPTTVNAFGAATTLNLGSNAAMVLKFGGAATAAEFRFMEPSGSGTNYTGFKAPALAGDVLYTLPIADGSNGQFLKTNGSAALAWATPAGSGDALVANPLSQFAATTSAQLAGVLSDETGTGVAVFGTSPAITTSLTTPSTTFALANTTATTVNAFGAATTLNIGAAAVTPVLNFGGGTASGELRFLEPSGSGTNYTGFKAQAQASNVTYTLPAADGANTNVLSTNGAGALTWSAAGTGTATSVAESFTGGLISVAGSPVTTSGTLALTVAGTSGGIPYFSSGTTWATSNALAANAIVIGGGAGAAPATTTTGTGVLTFLGTPSSANLAAALTDETGTGVAVFGTSPALTTSLTTPSTTFALLNTTATTVNAFGAATTVNTGASATQIWNFGGSTTASEFRFLEPSGSGTNYTGFKAVAQAANITYSLPPAVGAAGTVLTDVAGNGVLTWVAGGSGAGTINSGATNFIPKYTAATTIDDSLLSDDGTTLAYTGTGGFTASGPITAGGTGAGAVVLPQGTTQTAGTNSITLQAPSVVNSYIVTLPGGTQTGYWLGTNVAGVETITNVATIPVSTGGTGLTSGTSGGIPYYSGSGTLASSAALAANAIVVGGGAGASPSTVTTGTGIITALGVNTGSAGAPVLYNGAGGTPSSIDLTNGTKFPHSVTFTVDGGGSPFATGVQIPIKTPYGGTVTGYTMTASPSGSITFNIFRAADGAGLPTASIIDNAGGGSGTGTLPAIASGVEGKSTTLTNWGSTTITAFDNLALNLTIVDSTVTKCTLTLYYK